MTVVDEAGAAPGEAELRSNPYVGLRQFGPTDTEWFFGREREQRIIGANLRSSRLTLLYGTSGVGKSSVIMAAVVPALRAVVASDLEAQQLEDPELREPVRFAVSVFGAWRDAPLHGLMHAVAESVEEATGTPVAHWTPGMSLRETFAGWLEQVGSLLIVLDQFEEYFLYHPREDGSGTVAGEFVEVVNDPLLRVNFLVSLREDGLAKLDRFKGRVPQLFDNYLRVRHLDLAAARRAIVGPKDKYNSLRGDAPQATIDEELIQRVLDEVRTRDAAGDVPDEVAPDAATAAAPEIVETPLLQLVMHRLWEAEAASGGAPQLELATLTQKLEGTEKIVNRHVEEALNSLSEADRDLAVEVLRPLISPTGTKIAWRAKNIAHWAKHPAEKIEPILQALASGERRILRGVAPPPTEDDQSLLYELFHDILAQPILDWCAVREGESLERQRSEEVERLERERREELERLEAERRRERRNRAVRGVAIALGALTLGLIVAIVIAIDSRQTAKSRALAASATAQLQVDPERGLLLAMDALDRHSSDEATLALRRALPASRVRARLENGRARPCLACGALVTPAAVGAPAVVQPVALAPDGRTVAGFVGVRLQLWKPGSGAVLTPGVDVGEPIGVAFTPDSGRLLVVGFERAALMAPDGTNVVLLARGEYLGGAVSADGTYAATVGYGGASIWNADSGKLVASRHDADYLSASFGEGRRVALEPGGGGLLLWRWPADATSTVASADVWTDYPAFPARYSARGAFAVESGPTKDRVLVVAADGRRIALPTGTPAHPVTGAAISPDATRVAVVRGEVVELWGAGRAWVDGPRRAGELRHPDGVQAVVFSADGKLVGTASTDGVARVWDSSSGDLVAELRGHTAGVSGLAFSPGGRYVTTIGEDRTIRLWDLGRERTLLGEHPVEAVVTGRTGSRVVVVEDQGALKLWNARGGPPTLLDPLARTAKRRVSPTHTADRLGGASRSAAPVGLHPTSAALAADDHTLLVGYATSDLERGSAIVLDIGSGRVTRRLNTAPGGLSKVAIDRGARSAAIVRYPYNATEQELGTSVAELLDVRAGTVRSLRPTVQTATDVAFSPDGTRLLVTNVFGGAYLYDVRSGRLLRTLADGSPRERGSQAFYRGVFSPDGRTAAVAGSRDVLLWDTGTGRERDVSLSGHTSALRSVTYSSDGQRILTTSADGTVHVWDADTGTTLAVLDRHAGRVNGAAFLADGSIVSGGIDRAVRVYPCETCGPPDPLLDLARRRVTRDLTPAERTQFGR